MEASKAEEIATSPDELQDLQDDQLIHQQTEPEPAILRARELNAAGTACLIQVMANVEDRRSGDFSMFDTSKL